MIVNENLCKENYKFEVKKTKSDWESIGGGTTLLSKVSNFQHHYQGGGLC